MKLSNYLNLIGVVFGVFFFSLSSHAGVIKVGDAVEVALRGVPAAEQAKVNGQFRVRDDGSIRIPIINVNIQAAGQKPWQDGAFSSGNAIAMARRRKF